MVKSVLQLTAKSAGMRLSAEEFASADFERPYIYERVRGRLVVLTPAGPEHRKVSRPFRRELGGYWHHHPDVVDDVDVEGWVATTPDDDRIPDICVHLAGSTSGQTVPQRVSQRTRIRPHCFPGSRSRWPRPSTGSRRCVVLQALP